MFRPARLACAALLLAAAAPAPLPGGTIVHTEDLAARLGAPRRPVLIDVSPAPSRPPALAPGAVWLPLPHQDIPGSIWLPGAGREHLDQAAEAALRARIASVTGNAAATPIAVYCHPDCALSRNAAARLIGFGYTAVLWDPDGIEGWAASGRKLAKADPGWQGPGS